MLSVLTFRTPEEAVAKANNTNYGLACGVWSEKGSRTLWVAERLRAGVDLGQHVQPLRSDQPLRRYARVGVRSRGRPARSGGVPRCLTTRLDVRKTYKLLINGAFPRSESGRSYEVTSAKGAFLANAAQGSRKDVRDAVTAARGAQAKWWNATAYNRGQVLYRLAEMAESRRDELAEHVALSEGRDQRAPSQKSVSAAIDRWSGTPDGPTRSPRSSAGPIPWPDRSSTSRFPVPSGVVGVVCEQESSLEGFVDAVLAPTVRRQHGRRPRRARPARRRRSCLGEMTSSSDFPGGVLNIITGLTDELAPVLAAHEDVDGLDLSGVAPDVADGWRRWARAPSSESFARTKTRATPRFDDCVPSSRRPRCGTRLDSDDESVQARSSGRR